MAFSSGISRHLKVPLKYPVKPGPLRGPYAINLFSLCSGGGGGAPPPPKKKKKNPKTPKKKNLCVKNKKKMPKNPKTTK
jgi:hypothetical protein